ncbi:hypothetical protein TWF481_001349 [Arthrobotrys musiformis]|uniref:DUF3835 domain-containing protein n=1 Tax=Arthrobotrys musiformis TaxID=47236 RepID=A0AAV9WQ91_9PEZI
MDTIEVTEKQRQQLEASVAKLRKALKHWQLHSAEYEGLKEELLSLPKAAGRDKILAIADDFGGDVITREEITSFLGDKEGIKRGPVQVAEAVRHRIDYIQENIDKIEKQLEIGESTLDNVRIIKNSGQLTNDEGLPVMDIREDLDERGVVIKSDVNPAAGGSAQPFNIAAAIESFQPLVDTLSKKQKEKEKTESTKPLEKSKATSSSAALKSTTSKPPTSGKKPPTQDQIQQKPKPKVQPKTPKRIQSTEKEYSAQTGMVLTEKRVKAKLVPDVKEEAPKPSPKEEISVKEIISEVPQSSSSVVAPEQTKPGDPQREGIARIRVLDDSDDEGLDEDSEDPFNNLPNVEESEEDAQMREEMIKYNMQEMNNIVAEIELEEGDEDDYDDEDYDDDEDEDEDDEEDEDQWGRSKGRLVSDKVRREMMILQKKIEARDKAAQVAAEVEQESKTLAANTEQNKEIASLAEEPKKEKKKPSEKKGVRFAEELDIAPAPAPISKPPSNASQLIGNEFDDEDIDPSILDMIFGPGTADQEARYFQNTTEQPKKKLPSLFRAARQIQKAKEQSAIDKAPAAISGVVEKSEPPPPPPGSYEIIERTPSTSAPVPPKPTGKMPTRKTPKSTPKSKSKEPAPEEATTLDPLGAELSDEDRPIMAASVIERAPTWEKSSTIERAPPSVPDELDPDLHQREVANAYYSMRNKLIQRQGGFVETEEEKMEVPIDENMEKKKVSRFKAGRVKSQLP